MLLLIDFEERFQFLLLDRAISSFSMPLFTPADFRAPGLNFRRDQVPYLPRLF
jgi:hypothetical protein